jgi:hypothetical protein
MANTYVAIAKTVLTTTQATITFSSIPSTYTDLLLTISGRSGASSSVGTIKIRFNGATADTNLTSRYLSGATGTVGTTSNAYLYAGNLPGSTATSNTFCNTEVYLPNYAGSTYKAASITCTSENNSATDAWGPEIIAGLFLDTTAITQIELRLLSNSFVSGSRFDLYGIKSS